MSDKKTYRFDENALREKFMHYSVSFNADALASLEDEIAQVKTHNPIELPDTKKLLQFIGIPIAVAALGFGIYFGFNYIKNLPDSTPQKDTVTVAKPLVTPKVDIKKETPKPVNTASVVVNSEVKKQDTIIAVAPQEVKKKEKKTISEQVIVSKKDSGDTKKIEKATNDSLVKNNKTDTASASKNKDTTTKKKKKKRKSALDATEDIRQSQPNSADEDVIVPTDTSNPK